jgi:hypothetical protein
MSPILGCLALATPLLIAGCAFEGIYSEHPLGEELAVFKPAEWDGVWVPSSGGFRRWFVTDAEKGIMIASNRGILRCDIPTEKPVRLRQFGSWYFTREKEGPDASGLYETESAWFRLGDALVTYRVDVPRVRDLVEKGVLPGRLEKNRVILGALTPVHYKILLLPDRPAFLWQPSYVEVKLPAELDPCKAPAQAK